MKPNPTRSIHAEICVYRADIEAGRWFPAHDVSDCETRLSPEELAAHKERTRRAGEMASAEVGDGT